MTTASITEAMLAAQGSNHASGNDVNGNGLPAAPKLKVVDLRKMSRSQVAAVAHKHNQSKQIADPMKYTMHGLASKLGVADPERVTYPKTLGGNPR